MADSVLSSAEKAFLSALNELGVPFLLVGMSAALLEGASGSTQDLGLWFQSFSDPRIGEAARRAGGVFISGSFGAMPPAVRGGELGDRFDIVTHADGLEAFASEYAGALDYTIDGIPVRVLPLERVIASKRASNRAKDLAVLPSLEEALRAREG